MELLSENKDIERNGNSDSDDEIARDPIEAQKDPSFYTSAAAYWENVPATVDGVLGGFGSVSRTDLLGSGAFISSIFKLPNPPGHTRAVDCGAGIGRVTKFLIKHFGKVDLVEQCEKFINEAKKSLDGSDKVGEFYCTGLQNFYPEPDTYDVIWVQWVLGHLADVDFIQFFERMGKALKKNGVIVIKENVSRQGVILDETDSSVIRPTKLILELLKKAGMKILKNEIQRNFPKALFKVRMIALVPDHESEAISSVT